MKKRKIRTVAAKQLHHDYYVGLKRLRRLLPEDREQYELAIRREKKGKVLPLP
jgi:hypothetical protein